MRYGFPLIFALFLSLMFAYPVAAQGVIIDPPPVVPSPIEAPIRIASHRVNAEIEDQVATTRVEQVFVNEGSFPVEGTYIFPLPMDAAVSDFAMWVDGQRLQGKLLTREEARAIYESIVRRRRDPALLEYMGRGLFQASIFPIPPGGQRKVELSYSQVLRREGTLVRYQYPLRTESLLPQPVREVSVHISLRTTEPLKAIYSPSHDVAVIRDGDHRARVGYEATNVTTKQDFELYFSTAEQAIDLSVLSYRPAGEDGFFLLLATPPVKAEAEEVIAKDVVLVLDVSGSMKGEKIRQAQDALIYILDQLRPEDRFNVVAFSTGVRTYAQGLQSTARIAEAKEWVRSLRAVGGTDIHRGLLEALALLPPKDERPAVVIFLTDGLPTEGVTDEERIVADVTKAAGRHVRLFTFGVGDDVNTVLLDRLAQEHRGTSAYVRPGQRIDEVVSGFYAKVSQPVLTDLKLDFGGMHVEEIYPYPLPDLFAGSQLVVVGRYRKGGVVDLQLTGQVNGRPVVYTYEAIRFREEGGEPFIARLWATRKIGYLLTQIRLHGAQPELMDEVIELSKRYGIITPYTSYLVEELEAVVEVPPAPIEPPWPIPIPLPRPWDLLRPLGGRGEGGAAPMELPEPAEGLKRLADAPASGAAAVAESALRETLRLAERAAEGGEQVRIVRDKVFVWRDGVWVDTAFDAKTMQPERVVFGSDAYFKLLARRPALAPYFALGPRVIVVLDGRAYESVEEI
ncbi:MAG: VIT domain-containing protein [Anaerolineae bacterium]|nr:VIT domain-containing protein [Anaerolineae bacterium]MDW8099140.1 VIT domain-containing protein [Anaerolineae bacterium]